MMIDETLNEVGQLAQQTAMAGIKLFPFSPEKKPYPGFTDWQKWATTDLDQIRQWWIIWPEAMIAVPTGEINDLWVVDIDTGNGKQGLESLAKLEREYGPLPATMVVRTPSGGLHFYFNMPANADIRNSQGKIAPDIDIRGNGGLIVWPGSVRPDGKYEVIENWRLQ